jgi:hypothetical protein
VGVARRIHEYGLKPAFIYVVRDPIDRIESDHNYLRQHPHMTSEASLMAEAYVQRSSYYLQLSHYLEYFDDRDQYLILDFDRLKKAPDDVVQQVHTFLGLPPHPLETYKVHNETPDVSTLEQTFRTPLLYHLRSLVPAPLRTSLRRAMLRVSSPARETFTDAQRDLVRARLRDDIEAFGAAFDFDVSTWGF